MTLVVTENLTLASLIVLSVLGWLYIAIVFLKWNFGWLRKATNLFNAFGMLFPELRAAFFDYSRSRLGGLHWKLIKISGLVFAVSFAATWFVGFLVGGSQAT
jgi:hypothetical protein